MKSKSNTHRITNQEGGGVTKKPVKQETTILIPGRLDPAGLELRHGLTFEEWQAAGQWLQRAGGSVMWWVGDWWAYGEHSYGERASQAVGSEGYKFQTLADAGWVARQIETSRRREVLSWNHHREVASLEPNEQDKFLDKAEKGGWSRNELRTHVRRRSQDKIRKAKSLGALKSGKYTVIYADPPWRYENPPIGGSNRSIENQYSTMDLDEICALGVDSVAAEDAMLFLWVTAPKLAECFQVIDAWGFTYRTCMVWVKDKIGMGYHARNKHEILLIGKRGELPPPDESARPASVVNAPRLQHSAKPDEFYEIIEQMYPDANRLELFLRGEPREGWDGWGDEAEAA